MLSQSGASRAMVSQGSSRFQCFIGNLFFQMKLRDEWEYYMTEPQEVPYIPGRRRWTVSYRGGEIVKPLRRQLKKLVRIRQNEIYCNATCDGALDS